MPLRVVKNGKNENLLLYQKQEHVTATFVNLIFRNFARTETENSRLVHFNTKNDLEEKDSHGHKSERKNFLTSPTAQLTCFLTDLGVFCS